MTHTDSETMQAMCQHGNNFEHNLSLAYSAGSDNQRDRLKAAFPDIWERYAAMAGRDYLALGRQIARDHAKLSREGL